MGERTFIAKSTESFDRPDGLYNTTQFAPERVKLSQYVTRRDYIYFSGDGYVQIVDGGASPYSSGSFRTLLRPIDYDYDEIFAVGNNYLTGNFALRTGSGLMFDEPLGRTRGSVEYEKTNADFYQETIQLQFGHYRDDTIIGSYASDIINSLDPTFASWAAPTSSSQVVVFAAQTFKNRPPEGDPDEGFDSGEIVYLFFKWYPLAEINCFFKDIDDVLRFKVFFSDPDYDYGSDNYRGYRMSLDYDFDGNAVNESSSVIPDYSIWHELDTSFTGVGYYALNYPPQYNHIVENVNLGMSIHEFNWCWGPEGGWKVGSI